MSTGDFALLERNFLDTFNSLWDRKLYAVDEPNTRGGGWRSKAWGII